jgi:hypothetical protein
MAALGQAAHFGCGGSSTSTTPMMPVSAPPPVSIGNPTSGPTPYTPTYPPPPPQVAKGTGAVLATPHVIPVFFSGDKLQTTLNSFVQNYVTRSSSWQLLKEYGVGAGTVASAVTLTQSVGSSISDTDVQNFIIARVKDGSLTVDAQSIVVLFYPSGVTITNSGLTSCQNFGGYHGTTTANGAPVAYAVIPRCANEPTTQITFAVSHEIAESATDPLITSYKDMVDPYFLWTLNLGGSEIGDMCQNLIDPFVQELGTGVLTRVWSNSAAAAFNNPCVPAPAGPAFFSIAEHTQMQAVQVDGVTRNIEQIPVTAGQSTTINVRMLSNAKPSPTWSVTPMEVPLTNANGTLNATALNFSWVEAPSQPTASGQNGNTLHLKISANASGPIGYTTFRLVSIGPTSAGGKTETDWVGTVLVSH